jgi:type III restriction enzyme
MIQLKQYQERVLDSLREFFRQCARGLSAQEAFLEVTAGNGTENPLPYFPLNVAGLAGIPYICLRLPTGGGKTLLACYAAGMAQTDLLHTERGVVLWLVPSKTILNQTADALRDPRHPYRRALELSCGEVDVFTIDEALTLSRSRMDGQTTVIVSTIQSFRVEDTTGRKVYEANGLLMDHVTGVSSERAAELLMGIDGKPNPSLVNALRMRAPVVIVDEAHNARTELSFSTLAALNPSCIIEFTATPSRRHNPSNVLHRSSAAELKEEHMIKLPLHIVTRHPSQRDELLSEAVARLRELERSAGRESQETSEYLRPIMLVQAERVDACEALRDKLVADFRVAREEVKISTGKVDELQGVPDIAAPNCPVRFIITVEKLREGWDCPFAYVLCSIKETHSSTAIEQIVGRVLRLPRATEKRNPDLNCAYAFSVSSNIHEVLNEFREALETNGFTKAEAERVILPVPQGSIPLGTQPRAIRLPPGHLDADIVAKHSLTLGGKVQMNAVTGDVTIAVPLDYTERELLLSCVKTAESKAAISEAAALVAEGERAFAGGVLTTPPTPYELRLKFVVPRLKVLESGNLFDLDATVLMERVWHLSEKDASLPERYNPLERPRSREGLLDVSGKGQVRITEVREARAAYDPAIQLNMPVPDWTLEDLVSWLDGRIRHQDIPAEESATFLGRVVRGLMTRYGIVEVGILARDRFRLRDEVEQLIDRHRREERGAAFQSYLMPEASLSIDWEGGLDFGSAEYFPGWLYNGNFQFQKHYFGARPGELRALTAAGEPTEEALCAQFIDSLDEVRFWVRNLPRRQSSFRLHTATDWFYPDFVAQLKDGRILVVEYKGSFLASAADAVEKNLIGTVWASRSGGRCIFVMPTDGDFSVIERKVRA